MISYNERQINGQTDRKTDKQTDKQTATHKTDGPDKEDRASRETAHKQERRQTEDTGGRQTNRPERQQRQDRQAPTRQTKDRRQASRERQESRRREQTGDSHVVSNHKANGPVPVKAGATGCVKRLHTHRTWAAGFSRRVPLRSVTQALGYPSEAW